MRRKVLLFVLLLCMTEQVNALPDVKNSIALAWGIVQQHPFITAAVIVILLQEEPWEFVKEIIKYFLKEHPFLTTIVIGLLISGAYREIIDYAHGAWVVLRYAARLGLWLLNNTGRFFPEFHTNSNT